MKEELLPDSEVQTDKEREKTTASKKRNLPSIAMPAGKLPKIIGLAVLALISFFALGTFASDPGTYAGIVESLDEKRGSVLALMASTAGGAAALSLIPNAAPIANEMMDISSYFGIVLAAIYLEKYLLTLLGSLTFKLLVPSACILWIVGVVAGDESSLKTTMKQLAVKVLSLGLALVLVVPCSVWVSDKVQSTHEAYQAQENAAALIQDEEAAASEEAAAAEAMEPQIEGQSDDEPGDIPGFLMKSLGDLVDTAGSAVSDTADNVSKAAASAIEDGKALINQLFEQFAVMMVTTCLIPILVLLLFVWIINLILGTNIQVPKKPAVKPFAEKE